MLPPLIIKNTISVIVAITIITVEEMRKVRTIGALCRGPLLGVIHTQWVATSRKMGTAAPAAVAPVQFDQWSLVYFWSLLRALRALKISHFEA